MDSNKLSDIIYDNQHLLSYLYRSLKKYLISKIGKNDDPIIDV